MNLRWLWFDHVPPGIDLNDAQRRDVLRCSKSLRSALPSTLEKHGSFIASVLIAGLAEGALLLFVVLYLFPLAQTLGARLAVIVALPVFISGVFWIIIATAFNRSHSPFVRQALNEMGHPVCVKCGYALRGLDATGTSTCPECGTLCEPVSVKERSNP